MIYILPCAEGLRLKFQYVRLLLLAAAVATGFSASAVTVEVADGCAVMGDVVWSQHVNTNGTTKLALKAEAADGYVFAGWSVKDASGQYWPMDYRHAGSLTVTVATNSVVTASFIAEAEDELAFSLEDILPSELACGEAVFCPLEVDSYSFPTLKFKGLPPGITYDVNTLTLLGRSTAPGVYPIEATAVIASGFSFWCGAELRIGNLEGTKIYGNDTEIPLDEYYHAEVGDLFMCVGEVASATLTGIPPGLTWNQDWQLLYGTPTEPGDYTITAKVEFVGGGSGTATMVLSIVTPDPFDYDVDLDLLADVHVGDEFEAEDCVIGTDVNGEGIVSIAGLPTGLVCEKQRASGVRYWRLSGRLTKAGRFRVWVSVTDDSGVTQRVVRTSRVVTVNDVPQEYLTAVPSDAALGAISGAGPVTPGLPVKLTATPQKGYVFAGWLDEFGDPLLLDDGTDYRTPKVTLPAGTDYALTSLTARFSSEEEDEPPEFDNLDGASLSMSENQALEHVFGVVSASLPQLTFKGLPKGVVCKSLGTGEYAMTYHFSESADHPEPGRYSVTVMAENASGRKSSVGFTITVANRADPRVHIEDDYGEFSPGEEMDPIDLSDAVDFIRGETLSVSGLPRGLTYNVKANAKKGIEANTITGSPTVPGDYTLTFKAKVVSSVKTNANSRIVTDYEMVTVSAFLTVLPYPELLIETDDEALEAGCKVYGSGNYRSGTKVTLKATAAKGWVFAGWSDLDEVDALPALNPKLTYVSGEDDVLAYANFITVDSDYLYIDEPMVSEGGYAAELMPGVSVEGSGTELLIADLIDTGSWPTVKVTGLPSGLKFSASTMMLSGAPKKSGVYQVTVSAKNAGGYSFVRVFEVAVLKADGTLPTGVILVNDAKIDFTPWQSLMTGVRCQDGERTLSVARHLDTDAAVRKVTVSGLPAGLETETSVDEDGTAKVKLSGMPTKPGRYVVSISVAYAAGKSAKSQQALIVEDGGSSYFYVWIDLGGGSVSGEGVYAAGQTVKLSAKADKGRVFAGWQLPDAIADGLSGVDLRTPSISFVFPAFKYAEETGASASFVSADEDRDISVSFASERWEICPEETSACAFSIASASLPKASVKGLPRGVTMDVTRGRFVYTPDRSTVPGVYAVVVSVKNTTVTRAQTFDFEIRVANRTSDVIGGLDPSMAAYMLSAGVTLDPAIIVPQVSSDWKLNVKGLPSGLSFKDGAVTGVPTKVGDYTVTFTATSGSGKSQQTEVATILVRVAAAPSGIVGAFNGFVVNEAGDSIGTVSVSANSSGKLSASVKTLSGTRSFSAKAWDSCVEGVARTELKGKNGSSLSLTVDSRLEWPNWQMAGKFSDGISEYSVACQRSPYGKDGLSTAVTELQSLVGSSSSLGITIKIAKTGVVTVSGNYGGNKVSGSSLLFKDNAGYFAKIIVFNNKTSAYSIVIDIDDKGEIVNIESFPVIGS